jgi:hypothetical protein
MRTSEDSHFLGVLSVAAVCTRGSTGIPTDDGGS